jgi:hypothetical protein
MHGLLRKLASLLRKTMLADNAMVASRLRSKDFASVYNVFLGVQSSTNNPQYARNGPKTTKTVHYSQR